MEKNNEGLNLTKHYASVLVKPTEKVIATFGNDYFQNILVTRDFSDFSFILTDRRLYYKGTRFQQSQQEKTKGVKYQCAEETLDLKEITKSGFEHFVFSPTSEYSKGGTLVGLGFAFIIVFGKYLEGIVWLCPLILFVLGIAAIYNGYIQQKLGTYTAVKIDYAGGSMVGNIKLYGEASARDFLRQVKRAQDEYK